MRKDKKLFLTLFIILCFISVCCFNCAGENLKYETYEMTTDDVRLRYMQYPLFSFEYPEIFNLIDLNLMTEHAITMVSGVSKVEFTVQQTDLPKPILTIRVQEPGFGSMEDVNDAFRWWNSVAGRPDNTDNITTSKKTVFGVQADYLEIFGTMEEYDIGGHTIYPVRNSSFRGVFFEYADLIWVITMDWEYLGNEPLEVEGYFEHVIETFKFLE